MSPCRHCGQAFESPADERSFLEAVSPVVAGETLFLSPPTLCPACRMQRRLAWRNERNLYRRTCDLTGKSIITFYPPERSRSDRAGAPDSPYKVYDRDAWWSDKWDGLAYGRDVDFSRSFFGQFSELRKEVPRLGMVMTQSEGSAFSSYCAETKGCYMCTSCVVNEDSYYCYQANDSRDCVDCGTLTKCELCYECLSCYNLTSSAFCRDCENGGGLFFCQDCRGCTDCIGCKNLVNRKHFLFNEQKTKAEYEAFRESLQSYAIIRQTAEAFRLFAPTLPTRAAHLVQCENCTGDHLRQCRNAKNCFDAVGLEDCAHVFPAPGLGMKDCRDCHYSPGSELVWDSVSGMRCTRARFVLHSWDCEDITYTDECFSSKRLFGCAGLRRKEYCILNKQYTKEDYEALVPKIITRMREDGEYGEFPPVAQSPFAYNESIAQQEHPLTEGEARKNGWRWRKREEERPKAERVIPAAQLPDSIADIPDLSAAASAKADDILNWAIECEVTRRPFKIIKQELEFYRRMGLPVPRLHPDERYQRRLTLRNPRKLWGRKCMKCQKDIRTTYQPSRPEIVYCEDCYLKEVY